MKLREYCGTQYYGEGLNVTENAGGRWVASAVSSTAEANLTASALGATGV